MSYAVVGLLGRGASAVVELAVDGHGRQVAVKRVALVGSAAQVGLARRRLRREAEILQALDHPAIVPVLDVVDDGDDVLVVFPVMAENLEDRRDRLGDLPPGEVAGTGRALLAALAAAHRCGVVHRDVKPANVLFHADGRPALADFGVARSAEVTAGLTHAGTVVGTPTWMAPEQARGEAVGPASDVFSLAATLVFAATGETPYAPGPPLLVLQRAAAGQVRPLPAGVPAELKAPLAAMLDPDPARRPSAARVLGGLDGTAGALLPVPPAGRPAPALRRRCPALTRMVTGAGLAATLVVAVVLATALLAAALLTPAGGPRRARPASRRAEASPAGCRPLPYQPCGSAPAPHTDGRTCDPGWYDLDGRRADGCEAHSDYVAGTALDATEPVRANLVPLTARDVFTTDVRGSAWDLCWGSLAVTLTAPPRTAESLSVWHGATRLAYAVSAGGPATVTVRKPSCFGADTERLRVEVAAVAATGGASAADFTLTRDAGW